jgi:hypothetical protein
MLQIHYVVQLGGPELRTRCSGNVRLNQHWLNEEGMKRKRETRQASRNFGEK